MAVQLDDIDVLYVPSAAGVAGAAAAMECVEAALPTLRGRRFYGVCYDPEDDFRACVAIGPGDDVALGLHRGVIPGGHYAKAKVRTSDEIAEAFAVLRAEHEWDNTRPSIEFYRSEREILLYWPITQP